MRVNFSNVQRSNSRLQVSAEASDPFQPSSEIQLKAAPPTTGATFGRRLLNGVTLGLWTKNYENPSQWRAFRNAIVADLKRTDPNTDTATTKDTAKRLLQGYNPHKRLTAAKINNALADLARLQAGQSHWSAHPQRANASQAGIARALNSLKERYRNLSTEENRLVAHANDLLTMQDTQLAGDQMGVESFSGSHSSFAEEKSLLESKKSLVEGANLVPQEQEQSASGSFFINARVKGPSQAKVDPKTPPTVDSNVARQVISILRPGRQIDALALEPGMKALTRYAQSKGVDFAPVVANIHNPTASERIDEAIEFLNKEKVPGTQPLKLLALPFGLLAKPFSLQENHSVLIALDMRNHQVLYLDAKANSIEYAMKEYANAQDLKSQLQRLGKSAFGKQWNDSTGVLQLTQAKQQGANDCVAFTHDFTRQLIDGKSVGDIERTMTAADRRLVRLKMAQDIDVHVLRGQEPTD